MHDGSIAVRRVSIRWLRVGAAGPYREQEREKQKRGGSFPRSVPRSGTLRYHETPGPTVRDAPGRMKKNPFRLTKDFRASSMARQNGNLFLREPLDPESGGAVRGERTLPTSS